MCRYVSVAGGHLLSSFLPMWFSCVEHLSSWLVRLSAHFAHSWELSLCLIYYSQSFENNESGWYSPHNADLLRPLRLYEFKISAKYTLPFIQCDIYSWIINCGGQTMWSCVFVLTTSNISLALMYCSNIMSYIYARQVQFCVTKMWQVALWDFKQTYCTDLGSYVCVPSCILSLSFKYVLQLHLQRIYCCT